MSGVVGNFGHSCSDLDEDRDTRRRAPLQIDGYACGLGAAVEGRSPETPGGASKVLIAPSRFMVAGCAAIADGAAGSRGDPAELGAWPLLGLAPLWE